MSLPSSADVVYSVDASDRITQVNRAWTDFAQANDGEALVPPTIMNQLLWDFVVDETTRNLYRTLFARVRAGAGPVTFRLRCDGPSTRRLLEMSIVAGRTGALQITAHPLTIESRAPVPMLDPTPRLGEVLRSCGWCNRMPNQDGQWVEIEDALAARGLMEQTPLPPISHGICEDCLDRMMKLMPGPQRP